MILGNWVKAITPLTAASSTCVQFIDKKYNALLNKDVTTPSSNKNEYDSVETVSEDINESFDIYSEYRIASYSQLLICSTLTLIVSMQHTYTVYYILYTVRTVNIVSYVL